MWQDAAHALPVCGGKCIFLSAVCCGSTIRTRDAKNLNTLIRKASSVLGTALEPLELTVERKFCKNCSPYLTMQHIYYTTYFKNRAFSAGGSFKYVVTRTAIGALFSSLQYLCSMIPPLAGRGNLVSPVQAGIQVLCIGLILHKSTCTSEMFYLFLHFLCYFILLDSCTCICTSFSAV